ncbi:MAG: hypothetical protein QM692_24500, partial [Thermomicrobiales bacterium]
MLGDIWCSQASGRWYFTIIQGQFHRTGNEHGWDTRESAALALFISRRQSSEAQLHASLAAANN